MKISNFKTDRTRETQGVWVDIGDGARLLIARLNNEHYKQVFLHVSRPYKAQVRTGTMQEDLAEDLLCQCYSKAILLNWEGLQDDGGNEIPYSEEKAYELLKALPDFRALVEDFATTRELYRKEELEQAGN